MNRNLSFPVGSNSGFSAFGSLRPGRLGRTPHAPAHEAGKLHMHCGFCLCNPDEIKEAQSAAPCYCNCSGVTEETGKSHMHCGFCLCSPDETRETQSATPCLCLCTPVHEAAETQSAAPCFCMCTPVHETAEAQSASPCFCLCTPVHEGNA